MFGRECLIGGFPVGAVVKNLPTNEGDPRDTGASPGLGRSRRRNRQSAPVYLPGRFHGQRSLVGYKSMRSQRVEHD